MAKIIRPAYPLEFSIGLLLLIFVLSAFVSFEIFDTTWQAVIDGDGPILGFALAGVAAVVLALIMWEEFLFPVRIRPSADEIVFRNHFTKLKTEVAMYCAIPVIVAFIYLSYEVIEVPFFIWAAICIIAPAGKLLSGIRNYNDYLKFTNENISYKNNDKEGVLALDKTRQIALIKDQGNVLHKMKVTMADNTEVIIDLDEMELDAFCQTIEKFIVGHYGEIVESPASSTTLR